jgi:hypothetical protein
MDVAHALPLLADHGAGIGRGSRLDVFTPASSHDHIDLGCMELRRAACSHAQRLLPASLALPRARVSRAWLRPGLLPRPARRGARVHAAWATDRLGLPPRHARRGARVRAAWAAACTAACMRDPRRVSACLPRARR